MQKSILIVFAILLAIVGAVTVPQFLEQPEEPVMRWSQDDLVDGAIDGPDAVAVEASQGGDVERSEVEPVAAATGDDGGEPDAMALLRGRVIDKFQRPVAGARVWLEFARGGQIGRRGGRPRRIPDPVTSDSEGRFAFQGQVFRNLRVSLQVQHPGHAIGVFDKDLGTIEAEKELGDLMLLAGGTVRGRVTDLEGNGIASAELELQPDGRNRLGWMRNRDDLLPKMQSDRNGFYVIQHVAAGDYSLAATAAHHTEARSETFATEEEQVAEIPDIRLGPGYELLGYVRTTRGDPIADARVSVRPQATDDGNGSPPWGGGRGAGGPFGRGREHRTTTDKQGRFFLEHLPGATLEVSVDAAGYLDHTEPDIDPKLGRTLIIQLNEGLRIQGLVQLPSGAPLTSFSVAAVRLRALPEPGEQPFDIGDLMTRMRDGNLDEATRNRIRSQVQRMRTEMERASGPGRGGDRNPQGGPRNGRQNGADRSAAADRGKVEPHPEGRFVVGGLQEGVYEVHVGNPDYASYRSSEFELRIGAPAPDLTVTLDPGFYAAGVVLDVLGNPIVGAEVELRPFDANTEMRAPGGNGNQGRPDFTRMAREFARMRSGVGEPLTAKTDEEGLFVVKHAVRGTYRLTASARGFSSADSQPFELLADKSGFQLQLGMLGAIVGTVRGMSTEEATQVQVGAMILVGEGGGGLAALFGRGRGGSPFRSVQVQADGSYRIDNLAPGNYVVRSWIGDAGLLMQDLGPKMMRGELQADASVEGGGEVRLDLLVTRPAVGVVAGSVLHNGQPATGFRIELSPLADANAAVDTPFGRMGPGSFGPGGRNGRFTRQGTVAASGNFSIENVPAGRYELIATASRRGGEIHREPVEVMTGATTERNLTLFTSALRGTLTLAEGDPKSLAGRVSLLPDQVQVPENLNAWLRQNRSYDARVQDGGFVFEALPPGNYLLVTQLRDRKQVTQSVTVQGDQSVTVPAGEPNPPR